MPPDTTPPACSAPSITMARKTPGSGLSDSEARSDPGSCRPSCAPNRYSVVVHGVGLCDEYPPCAYAQDFERSGYDGLFKAGMTVCVENYIGEVGGDEGVKLKQQILITDSVIEVLSTLPFEDELLSREI